MLLVPVCSAELECPLSTCNIACLFSTVCLCASIFQKALFASCTNLTWVDIRKRIKAGVKMSQYRLELLQHCRRQACQDPRDWRGLWGCCSLGLPLALYFPVVFILWTFLIGTGEHRIVCHGIISPTMQRTLCRLPLVQIKHSTSFEPSSITFLPPEQRDSYTWWETCFQKAEVILSMEEATANSALLSSQLKISFFLPLQQDFNT